MSTARPTSRISASSTKFILAISRATPPRVFFCTCRHGRARSISKSIAWRQSEGTQCSGPSTAPTKLIRRPCATSTCGGNAATLLRACSSTPHSDQRPMNTTTNSIYGKVAKGEPYRKAGARLTEDAEDVQKRTKLGDAEQQMREYQVYHRFDKAHLVMLAEQGFLKPNDAAKMLLALRRMEDLGIEKVRAQTEAGEHSGEAWLITELGEEVGGRIHAGRSSGDFMAVTSRIFIRDFILKL